MANNETVISRYINEVATLRHQLIVAEVERDEAREESANKDGAIEELARQLRIASETDAEAVEGTVVSHPSK